MNRDPAETSNHHAEDHGTPRDVLETFAQDHFGLSIDEPTHERWGDAISLMQRIDTLIASRNFVPEQAFKTLFGPKSYAKRYPSLGPVALGPARYNKFTEHVESILGTGEFASLTTLPEQYIEAREVQAYAAVEALGCIASDELRADSVFANHYLNAMAPLAVITVLRDSIRSGAANHRRGKLRFTPEPRHDSDMADAISRHSDALSGILLRAPLPITVASRELIAASGLQQYPDVHLLGT